LLGQPGQRQAGGRIGGDSLFARQPLEPAAQRAEAAELGAERQWRAVRLAVGEQGALVAFEDFAGDLGRLGQAVSSTLIAFRTPG
jgi:hypothetical protein